MPHAPKHAVCTYSSPCSVLPHLYLAAVQSPRCVKQSIKSAACRRTLCLNMIHLQPAQPPYAPLPPPHHRAGSVGFCLNASSSLLSVRMKNEGSPLEMERFQSAQVWRFNISRVTFTSTISQQQQAEAGRSKVTEHISVSTERWQKQVRGEGGS